jgi:hypothetical protein
MLTKSKNKARKKWRKSYTKNKIAIDKKKKIYLHFFSVINYNLYMDNDNDNLKPAGKKPGRLRKIIITLSFIFVTLILAWTAFSLIGRVDAALLIPDSTGLRVSISNPIRFINNFLAHESLQEISNTPALAALVPILHTLHDAPILRNPLLRLTARGNFEAALLPSEIEGETGKLAAAWDMGFLSPLLRILPVIYNFVNVPDLYYVQAGSNSRFELRTEETVFYIGPYRNLLFISNDLQFFYSRSAVYSGHAEAFNIIKPSAYDAALVLSDEFITGLLSEQAPSIAAILENIEFESRVEAGISIYPKKFEFYLAAPLNSHQESLSGILGQRSRTPGMAERVPADAQYATIISAGTLEELYNATLVFAPEMDDALKAADNTSRFLLGLSLNDLLFSWSGNEFAVIGLEGRPTPIYAIQIADERKRQEVFERAFRSLVLNENVRLNLDGTRIPRIEVPEFLQSLLRRWNVFIPSPYYIIHRDFIYISESAEALLSALRAMQRNNVLPGTADWRNIAGERTTASAFSLYYSLDLSIPFFLRKSTDLTGFLTHYRQGFARISIDRGMVELSLSLVPGSGSGVILMNGYPLDIAGRPSNRVYGAGSPAGRVFFSSGGTAFSLDMSDNTVHELSGQGSHWIIYADGAGSKDSVNAWIVTDRGRVTLVNGDLEPFNGFPVLTGMRLSAPPAAYNGKLYLCDESGKVHVIDENGRHTDWETSFIAALRSPPNFLTVTSRNRNVTYAAVYPKSFFGEIWLLDANGKALPNWPAPISVNMSGIDADTNEGFDIGVGFGSPLVFAHNSRGREPVVQIAFVNQSGQLLLYNESAELVPPFPVVLDGIFYQQPVFDGEYLWLVSSDGKLFRVNFEGEALVQQIHGFSVLEEGYITVFNSSGKEPEIYITGDGNALYAFTRHFRSLEGFPLPVWGKPHFVPPHGGGRKAEIFGIGMSERLYRYQFR